MEPAGRVVLFAGLHPSRKAHDGGHPDAALPGVALGAVHHPVAVEKGGGVVAVAVGLVVGAVVGGEHHQRLLIQVQVLQELQHVAHPVVDAPHHAGVALLLVGPVLPGVVRVDVAVDGVGHGVDEAARLSLPLHPALQATPGRVGRGGYLQTGVGGVVGQVQEERLLGILLLLVDNPLLGRGREQVGGVDALQLAGDLLVLVVELHLGALPGLMGRVVVVAVPVAHVA